MSVLRLLGAALVVLVLASIAGFVYVRVTGLRAGVAAGPVETRLARAVRQLAVTAAERNRQNPVPVSAAAIEAGLTHFADHCASCHANDGSGETELGRGMYPAPPDMRQEATQRLTDGELFHIIEHGIRFTGMPAFGGDAEHEVESWHLVHFIRHLAKLTDAELARMRELNPRPPAEVRQEIEEERFLRGEDLTPAAPGVHGH